MKKIIRSNFFILFFFSIAQFQSAAQGVYTICSATSITDSTGTLYDSGGPNDVYHSNENCTLLVAPSCAITITLSFQNFATESGFDSFTVYDGNSTNAPELLIADGNIVPSPITSSTGYMLIVWSADGSSEDSGFACTWTSTIAQSSTPTAAFSIGNTNPPLGVGVKFNDHTIGATSAWLWSFGDGDSSRNQNPIHAYAASGIYTVTLISFHCSESDTISNTITVQPAPHINITPSPGFNANAACGDSANFTLSINNSSGGKLVYNSTGANTGAIKVLAMTYGSNLFVEFPRTLAAIDQYFTNYILTTTDTVDPVGLNGLLQGKNVLLITEQQNGSDVVWIALGPVIRQFLSNGGSVIFCGSASSLSNNLFSTGVFNGSFVGDETGKNLEVLNNTDPLTAGLNIPSFTGPNATYSLNITNPDKVTLVRYHNKDVVAYRYFGSGKAIYVGFDFYNSDSNSKKIIANAIEWGGKNALPPWIHLSLTGDTVNPGTTSSVGVTFLASGLFAGTYFNNIGISNNDPSDPFITIPCTLTVSGSPIIEFSDNCLTYGQVMQHKSIRDTLKITNTGCDTLFISNINSTSPAFIINANFSYLLPGVFADVIVTFNGHTVGTFLDTIHILNNDVDTFVCLSATTFPAPVINASTSSIILNIRACNKTGSVAFNILNTGGSNLIFHLNNLPSWLTAVPESDTLLPASESIITLNFNSAFFPAGPQTTNIQIVSNDPLAPNKFISFTMNVDSNPCIDFSIVSNTCTGVSNFTSTVVNLPVYYHWDFGDGDTANVSNPSHGYSHAGAYSTIVTACNAHGCDTMTKTVNAIITGPKPADCIPTTLAYSLGVGITLFQVTDSLGFRFNKTSADAADGYKDYTCTDNSTLITNFPYNININTGFSLAENVRAWLDMNNDGVFDSNTELIFSDSFVLRNHSGTFNIPALPTNIYNAPIRLRLASDYSGNPDPQPCQDLISGQVEDYSVFLSFNIDVNEINREAGFKVYPNPFQNAVTIEYNPKRSSEIKIDVFNIVGEKIKNISKKEQQIPGKYFFEFPGIPSGIYFVRLIVDGKTSVQKIIKL